MKNVIVSTTSQDPIYQQLYDQISFQIFHGDLESDSLLPSIRMMAKELRVSIITIKKTWELLEREGFIYTIAGKGSYVQRNTQAALDKRKITKIKQTVKETVSLCENLGISKKKFKDGIGTLYKEKRISIEDDCVRLI